MPGVSDIRPSAVAGMFYSGDAPSLTSIVDRLLGAATSRALPAVRVLLAPHAGYAYSGAIAARGFARVRDSDSHPSRAFIIGPSHVEPFDFTSVYGGAAYHTPLGDVAVDTDAARSLARSHPSIRVSGAGHDVRPHERGEHAIEVELPFLQRCFTALRIVPVVMGDASWAACEALGAAVSRLADWRHDVIIASSDLSHFHDDRTARSLDQVFCDSFLTLDARSLHDRVTRGQCEACGAGPVVAALLATASLRHRRGELLAYGNSGDVNHDRSSVVGYASAVVTGEHA